MLIGVFYYLWALTFDLSTIGQMPQRSEIYDRTGTFYSRTMGENRVVVPYDQVSPNFVKALISREDSRFYEHRGIDPLGIARAAVRNLLFGSMKEGASTLLATAFLWEGRPSTASSSRRRWPSVSRWKWTRKRSLSST